MPDAKPRNVFSIKDNKWTLVYLLLPLSVPIQLMDGIAWGDWATRIPSALMTLVTMETGVLVITRFVVRHVEFLPEGIRFATPWRFFEAKLTEITRITFESTTPSFQTVKVMLSSGRTIRVHLNLFEHPDELRERFESLAIPHHAQLLEEPPSHIHLQRFAPLFTTVGLVVFLFLTVFLVMATITGHTVAAVGLAIVLFLSALATLVLRIELTPVGLLHPAFGPQPAPYDKIDRVWINVDPDSKVETIHIYSRGTHAVIRNNRAGSENFPLVRDLILLRATNAVIYGETDPAKLRLCTLPGPLDQLHAKPIDPATTDQHEESVHA